MGNNYKLAKCNCGGEVYLSPSAPWDQDPAIHCNRCGGVWKYGTYSDYLTINEWNDRHLNPLSDLRSKEIPTTIHKYKYEK